MFSFEAQDGPRQHLILAPVMMVSEGDRVIVVDPRSKSVSVFTRESARTLLGLDCTRWTEGDRCAAARHPELIAFVEETMRLGIIEMGQPANRAYDAAKITGLLDSTTATAQRIVLNPPALPTVNINERCRFSCLHCYNGTKANDTREMTSETIRQRVLPQLASMGCVNVMWCGGDPALTPSRTIGCTEEASALGISAAAQVGEFSKAFLGGFAGAGGKAIQVSLYSSASRPDIDDRFRRRRGSWTMAVRNIEEARRVGLSVFVNMVLFPENAGELAQTAELAYEMGASTFRTTFSVITGAATQHRSELEFSREETERLMDEAVSLRSAFSNRMGVVTDSSERGKLSNSPYSFCSAGMTYLHIAGGKVYPCNFMMVDAFCMGNIMEEELDQIWRYSSAAAPFRSVAPLSPQCVRCEKRESTELACTDCKAVMWERYGTFLNADAPACRANPSMRK